MIKPVEKIKKLFSPVDLRKGKEWKVIFLFSLPIVLSYLLQQVYTVSDAIICGQTLSADEVAGVNDVSPLVFIFLQFAFGCTAGFGVVTSARLGEGDEAGVRRSFASQIILCAAVTVVLTVVSVVSLKPMLAWINVTPENGGVFDAAYGYCLIIFAGIAAQMFYNFICTVLRSVGDSVTPLAFLAFSTVLNIGLDLLFIVVFRWGVFGAAGATVAAQALSTAACFIYTFARYKNLRLCPSDFKPDFAEYKAHAVQGIPLGLQFSVLAIGLIVMQGELVRFDISPQGIMVDGNPAQNGYGSACKLSGLLMSAMNALGTGVVSFTAQNYGAGERARVKKGVIAATLIMFIFATVLAGTGLLMTLDGTYQRVFLSADKISERSQYFGNYYLYIALSFYFLLGLIFIWRSAVQGIGKSGFTLGAGVVELAVRVIVCLLLPSAFNGGAVNSQASHAAYCALCFADPVAWLGAVSVLAYPVVKYIFAFKNETNDKIIQGE